MINRRRRKLNNITTRLFGLIGNYQAGQTVSTTGKEALGNRLPSTQELLKDSKVYVLIRKDIEGNWKTPRRLRGASPNEVMNERRMLENKGERVQVRGPMDEAKAETIYDSYKRQYENSKWR